MNKVLSQNQKRLHRKSRIRAKVSGTAKIPRLSVFRSLRNLRCQAINDELGTTLVSCQLADVKAKNDMAGAMELGKMMAKKCADKKIETVVFDRSGYKYHGKVKALADGAREGGLRF